MIEELQLEEQSQVRYEGSWGASESQTMTLSIYAKMNKETGRGHFEIFDLETRGDRCYAEGSLSLYEGELCDYDGVSTLDRRIVKWLDEIGCVSNDKNDYFRKRADGVRGY